MHRISAQQSQLHNFQKYTQEKKSLMELPVICTENVCILKFITNACRFISVHQTIHVLLPFCN